MLTVILIAIIIYLLYLLSSKNKKIVEVKIKSKSKEKEDIEKETKNKENETNSSNILTNEEIEKITKALCEFYKNVSAEMISKQNYTIKSVEERCFEWLDYLFKTLKNFDTKNLKADSANDIEIEIEDNTIFENEKDKRTFKNLKSYLVLVIKSLKTHGHITKEKVIKLSEEWLKDYLRVQGLHTSFSKIENDE